MHSLLKGVLSQPCSAETFTVHAQYNIYALLSLYYFIYLLAPEAVTGLDYEQSYGNDNPIKLTLKWMVSLQSMN